MPAKKKTKRGNLATDEVSQIEERVGRLKDFLTQERAVEKFPLFVVGAGVSAGRVPFLWEIGAWLLNKLSSEEIRSKIAPSDQWILENAEQVAKGAANRRVAAEFWSAIQEDIEPFRTIWEEFSTLLLIGGIPRLNEGADGALMLSTVYQGLMSRELKPTEAHFKIAHIVAEGHAYVLSLNFDRLTHKAFDHNSDEKIDAATPAVVCHTAAEVSNYFCSTGSYGKFFPAVFKVRGDVFYARCSNPPCSLSQVDYPLDRIIFEQKDRDVLKCVGCNQKSLRLQFSFPGFRLKEEQAYPLLGELKRFLGLRISTIIIIGLSGRWDRYLLEFLLNWALEMKIPIIDVKPDLPGNDLINEYRELYFPGIKETEKGIPFGESVFMRVYSGADAFCSTLEKGLTTHDG
ncbi:MAG: hypothetical protein C4532_05010 [Candidatus Abyssobacteria bacterium SURF_17]|uniref:Deacetylase sirtuin-type domain-containing protein n=1 Tax=Candidatus Abyssobacteria bacterium SURF_17 TaxID=2093361 RepID=A0A419F3M1_9BACT|nr:MAG: hypothetical protein C4532_05010 [Candidatus Abyssubacteria bacterium SURF_17]